MAIQPALDKAATGERTRGVQEAIDRLARERGENEGMIVHQDVTFHVHNIRNTDAITTR
ncbi:MAG: hypothetical protein WBO37_05595 [Gammaproteobacteria bacterium]